MKRRNENAAPMRVYRYGCQHPIENEELVRNTQMPKGHAYQNTLIRIERAKRKAIADVQAELVPAIDEVRSRIAELDAQVDAIWSGVDRKKLSKVERQKIKDVTVPLNAERLALRGRAKALKAEHAETLKAAYKAVEERKNVLVKAARAECGAYWGTYLLAEKAVEEAIGRKDTCPPEGPNFRRRWDGSHGRVGVQIQGGAPIATVLAGTNTLVRLLDDPRKAGKTRRKGRASYKMLWLRIDSDEKGKPVWAKFPLYYHRPFPADAVIKNAYVSMNRVSPSNVVWSAHFSIESADTFKQKVVREVHGVNLGINFGWYREDDSSLLRVAYWVKSNGEKGKILLPAEVEGSIKKADDLRSIRKHAFNEAKEFLWSFQSPSPWLASRIPSLILWKNIDKLSAVVKDWKDHRFEGDDEIYAFMEAWRRKDRHLHDWEGNARKYAVDRRNNHYREEVLKLVRSCDTICVDDTNYADLAQKVAEESFDPVSWHRFVCAVGWLRAEFKAQSKKNGQTCILAPHKNKTLTCHKCENVLSFDKSVERVHTCEVCGASWDQDYNAAMNCLAYLASGPETVIEPEPLAAE